MEAEDPAAHEAEAAALRTSSKVKIEPLHSDVAPPDAPAAKPDDTADEPGTTNESFDSADTLKAAADADSAKAHEAAEQAAMVEKLIETRQYYLPINQVQRRRTKQFIWLLFGAVIVFGAAWTYLLLDAGLVNIPGVKVPTHFFK